MTATMTAIAKRGIAYVYPDSRVAANIESLLQKPEVTRGAPANDRPARQHKDVRLFHMFSYTTHIGQVSGANSMKQCSCPHEK